MTAPRPNYEELLLQAISQAKAGAPQVSDELRICASQSAEAIAKVTNGVGALDLIPLSTPDERPPAYQLQLRRVGHDGPPSDLGVYQLSEAGYPIQRWYSLLGWQSDQDPAGRPFFNKGDLEGHFRWMISDRSSRLVVLVAFIMQETVKENSATSTS